LAMVPKRSSLILLAVASSHAALLKNAQRASNKRVRALIAPVISAVPTLPEPERVDTYWKQDDSALSQRLARMLEATPSLQQPTYQPTTWAKGSKANFALAFARSRAGELRRKVEPPLSGGAPRYSACDGTPDVVVEWAKDEAAVALPLDAPIVVFLHTITGTAAQTRWLMSGASQRGWRSCVFVRRGHKEKHKLCSPSFNLLGDVGDVERQLDSVRRAYPRASFVGMIGISAGSGLLISYLGRAGASTPVGAACAICPAWDVGAAFEQMGTTQPAGERSMLQQIKKGFLKRNEPLLRGWDEQAYEACLAATSLPGMLSAHAPFAMRERGATGAEYLAAHDPMQDRHGVTVPTLVLNAEDDFVCPAALAQPEVIVEQQPGCLLLVARSGSHVAFNEGRSLRRSPFHLRVSLDFLESARATADGARPFLPPPMRSFMTAEAKVPGDVEATAVEATAVPVATRVSPPAALRGVVVPTRRQRRVDAGASSARPRDDAVP